MTLDCIVTLSGRVRDESAKQTAKEVAEDVPGVCQAFNDKLVSDAADLLSRVTVALRKHHVFKRVDIGLQGCSVTLFGAVYDDEIKERARQTVGSVNGVCGVTNQLTTDTAEQHELESRLIQSLQEAGLKTVTAKVVGRDCYLHGTVDSEEQKQMAVGIAEHLGLSCPWDQNFIRVVPRSFFRF